MYSRFSSRTADLAVIRRFWQEIGPWEVPPIAANDVTDDLITTETVISLVNRISQAL